MGNTQRLSRDGGLGRRPLRVGRGQEAGSNVGVAGAGDGDGEDAGEATRDGAGAGTEGVRAEAGDGSGGKTDTGLRRSIETVTGLFPFRMVNVLADLDRTSKGPSYGGTKGRRTASTRRKTWEEETKAGLTLERTLP